MRRILPNTQNVCCIFVTVYVTYLSMVTFCIVNFFGINFILYKDYSALLIDSCAVKQRCRITTPKYGLHLIFDID